MKMIPEPGRAHYFERGTELEIRVPAQRLPWPDGPHNRLSFCSDPGSPLTVDGLRSFLSSLPKLGDDANDFIRDLIDLRAAFPVEANPWD